MKKNKQFAVLGLGRFGFTVATKLSEEGFDVLACDKNPTLVKQIEPYVTDAVIVDFNDQDALSGLGLQNYDTVVIAIGSMLESAIMATIYAKECGVECVIAKAMTFQQKKMFEKLGADKIVMPEFDSGKRLVNQITKSNVLEFISVSDEYGFAKIKTKKQWAGKSLKQSNIRAEYGINVVAIQRSDNDVIINPHPDEVIMEEDSLIVIGENKKIQQM